MSRSFSRPSASGFSLRFATIAFCAASLVSVLALSGSARAQGLFQSPAPPNLNTGTTPQGVAAADFGRTGYQGLVVANSNSGTTRGTISVFLATGPNTYSAGTTYNVCKNPTAVVATDINSDGYPDIVVACTSSNTVDVLLNNGAGGTRTAFGTATGYGLASSPVALVAGDFVGNGNIDIATANSGGSISVLLNTTGNGTFTVSTVAGSGTLSGIAAGDFNNDGHLDLVASDSSNNTVHVLFGSATGTFTLHNSYSVGTGTKPSDIVAADFNHDGNLDVATANAGKNTATILLGNGTGTLTVQTAQATGTDPIAIVTTDVDSDGNPDVVVFDSPTNSTGEIDVLLGNGNGTLQTAQTNSETFEPGTQAAVADFNRDGKPDIALVQQDNALASVLLNNTLPTAYPDGRSFATATQLTNGKGNFADSVAVGDFNKDGKLDIAVSYLQDNTVQVLLNNGSNGFNASSTYAVGKQPYSVASADLNGDGYPDLVTANTTDGTVSVLLNNRNGTFAAAVPYTVGTQPYQVAIGDVNGDGYPDLAVTNYGANTVSILFGSKTGTFTAQTPLTTCASPYGVAIGDFAHNGNPSVAVTCYTAAELEVFPNNGNGIFGTPFITATETNPASLVVGDFNRDGNLDIVAANTTPNDIDFYAGAGNNTFAAGVESPSLNFPDSIAAGDFNGDGILDIVGVSPNFNAVELTLGVGDGTFGTFDQRAAGEFAAVKQPWALAVGDFNNDGQLDIVTANNYYQVNLASPAYQSRYLAAYPAVPGGNPSIDLLTNASAVNITVTSSPASPVPAANTDVTVQASVQPAYSGVSPTGSVIFENSAGTVLGTGPYTLTGGVAKYISHLGSGVNLFTSLYSGDSNYQPATVSGSGASVTVAGTPVTLALNPSSVNYGSTFVATVTAIGNATTGSYPHGTATIYIDTGGTPIALGTTAAFTQVGGGSNNSSRTITITASDPNLAAGSYELYAVFNPTSGSYAQGSSSDEPLSVNLIATTTTLTICGNALVVSGCEGQVSSASGANPSTGNVVLTVNGLQVASGAVSGTGSFAITYSFSVFTQYYITATYQGSGAYTASTSSVYSLCELCGLDRTSPAFTLDSLTGSGLTRTGLTGGFFVPTGNTGNSSDSNNNNDNQNSKSNDKKNTPFSIF